MWGLTFRKFEDRASALRRTAALAVVLSLFQGVPAHEAQASTGRDVRTMLYASGYGVLGGTAMGLVSLPFHRSTKGVYLGSLLGLGLGLMVGAYHVTHRDDPGNPLRGHAEAASPAALGLMVNEAWRGEGRYAVPRPEVEWSAAVYRFD